MKAIKFRAWNSIQKKMVYGSKDDEVNPSWILAMCQANNIEPMQYSGLEDKNGTEIYAKDICRDEHGDLFYVSWRYGCFLCGEGNYMWEKADKCVVMGNIYSHPELYKEANK